jgi:large subunit ribosomal protein L25
MAKHKLTARVREQKGKEAAKKMRNDKKIPAVFYGAKSEPVMLTVQSSDLNSVLKNSASDNIIIDLQIESEKGSDMKMVILKELQTEPLKGEHLHADFHEIDKNTELTLDIPVRLINTPVGVTNGGILQHIRREMTISCLPDSIIEYIDVDVSGLDLGQTIHVKDIAFPEGITSMLEDDITIAVVNSPDGEVSGGEGSEEEEDKSEPKSGADKE